MNRSRPYPPHRLGAWGETLAALRLAAKGWHIVEQGYRLGRREIDLIVRRDAVLAFVEVKTRSGGRFGDPEDAVTWQKRAEIEAVAADYLLRHDPGDVDVRFDVIAVVVGPGRELLRYDHLEDAWRPGFSS